MINWPGVTGMIRSDRERDTGTSGTSGTSETAQKSYWWAEWYPGNHPTSLSGD